MNQPNNIIDHEKQRFRIHAISSDLLIADIWAESVDDAWKIASEIDGDLYRNLSGDWELDSIRQLNDEDLLLEPFQPVN